jgi:hypothetical protein
VTRLAFSLVVILLFSASGISVLCQQLSWTRLSPGLELARIPFSFEILCGDSAVTLFRIHRESAGFHLHSANGRGKKAMTAEDWAESEDADLVFNAGMYIPGTRKAKAQMMASGKWIQKESLSSFGGIFFLDGPTQQSFLLADKSSLKAGEEKTDFDSYFECMRLVDGNGIPLSWEKKKQRCSMLVAAEDSSGNFILAFCRSPMLHSVMAKFLSDLPLGLRNAFYMEGGPETSIFLRLPNGQKFKWIGTYVSETWERNDNQEFRTLPNVVGIKFSP